MPDANARALADQFLRMGWHAEDVSRRFTEFGQPAMAWKPGQVLP